MHFCSHCLQQGTHTHSQARTHSQTIWQMPVTCIDAATFFILSTSSSSTKSWLCLGHRQSPIFLFSFFSSIGIDEKWNVWLSMGIRHRNLKLRNYGLRLRFVRTNQIEIHHSTQSNPTCAHEEQLFLLLSVRSTTNKRNAFKRIHHLCRVSFCPLENEMIDSLGLALVRYSIVSLFAAHTHAYNQNTVVNEFRYYFFVDILYGSHRHTGRLRLLHTCTATVSVCVPRTLNAK